MPRREHERGRDGSSGGGAGGGSSISGGMKRWVLACCGVVVVIVLLRTLVGGARGTSGGAAVEGSSALVGPSSSSRLSAADCPSCPPCHAAHAVPAPIPSADPCPKCFPPAACPVCAADSTACPAPPPCDSAPTSCPACPTCPDCPSTGVTAQPAAVAANDDELPGQPLQPPDVSYVNDDFDPRDPLNVIYFHSPFHWPWHLDHWLKGLDRPVRMYVDTSGQMCMGNSIIVVNHLSVKESKFDVDKYLARCASRDIDTIGVFHTGDIEFNQKYTYYSKVKFVYRNHYPDKATQQRLRLPMENVRLLPLGSKFLETISVDNFYQVLPTMRRKHFCSFVGALKHSRTREAMATGLIRGGYVKSTDSYKRMGFDGGQKCAVYFSGSNWSDKKQMVNYEYRSLLSNTVFALVPLGRGPDSFRLYEALELGAIPIITDHGAFTEPFGPDCPLPRVPESQWDSAPVTLLNKYYDDRAATFELQQRVFTWWVQWKYKWKKELADLINTKLF